MGAKAFVRIYCKIFCDNFPDDGFTDGKLATGEEIYDFLTRSLGYAIDPDTEESIPGDLSIFYLGSAEKFGVLSVNENVLEWGFGESNWDRVLLFLRLLSDRSVLTVAQYVSLISRVEEGMKAFDDMYMIPAYLKAKREGVPWVKKSTNTKGNIKQIVDSLKQSMEEKGYKVIFPHCPVHQNNFNE